MKKEKMESITELEKSVLREISTYFGPSVHNLSIKSIEIKKNKIFILLGRPGLFIGKHGQAIDNIKRIIHNNSIIENPEIYVYESELDNHLSFYNYINPDFELL